MAKYNSEEEVLKYYDTSKYRTPDGYTSDIAIFTLVPNEQYKAKDEKSSKYSLALMLIKRAELDAEDEPNIEGNKWALPGGFTQIERDKGSAFESAKRELRKLLKYIQSETAQNFTLADLLAYLVEQPIKWLFGEEER